jgi:16S rRNA (uracil1498-N3)-methyltransferase
LNIFYCPDIKFPEATLSPEESAHCIRVLRMGRGDRVQVIDGQGGYYNAIITDPDPGKCRIEMADPIQTDKARNYTVHIAIAPTKNMDRFEWFTEKSVEIGIDFITPLLCQRSERRVLKTDRLEKLIISTMKQAIIPWHPVLSELTPYRDFVSAMAKSSISRFIATCEHADRKFLRDACTAGKDTVVLIGPEGDFSPEEITLAVNLGFVPVSLGTARLRTETAGIVACHTVHMAN